MPDQDNLFTVIALASVGLAIALCAGLVLTSLGHMVLAAGRASQGRPAKFDGWVAARVLVIVIAAVAALMVEMSLDGAGSQMVVFICLFAVLCAPMLIAIFQLRVVDMEKPANQDGPRRLGLAAKNLVYIFGLPGIMTVFVMAGVALDRGPEAAWNAPMQDVRAMNYYQLPRPTGCSDYLRTVTPVSLDSGPRSPDHMIHAAEFWLDTTLNALTFSAFDTTGCYIRRVDYNRENARMVATVATYNLILLFVISTIVYSVFKHKVRKGVERATAHA